jgi:hypothetical protein
MRSEPTQTDVQQHNANHAVRQCVPFAADGAQYKSISIQILETKRRPRPSPREKWRILERFGAFAPPASHPKKAQARGTDPVVGPAGLA